MSSGCDPSTRGPSSPTNPIHTFPAPECSAARPARSGAPNIPGAPPTTPSVPNVPLFVLRARRSRHSGSAAASAGHSRRWPCGPDASTSRPSGWTDIAPASWLSGPVRRPGLRAMNVAVAVARIAGPRATPVSASSPLGISSARIGSAIAPACSTRAASPAAIGRARPIPKRPSTMSAPRQPEGMSGIVVPPASRNARWAAAASGGALAASPR